MVVIDNFKKGWKTDLQPFLIERDAFSVLYNAISDNGSVFKKRGLTSVGVTSLSDVVAVAPTLLGMTASVPNIPAWANRNIIPGSIFMTITTEVPAGGTISNRIVDDARGNLVIRADNMTPPSAPVGTINYLTGNFSLTFDSTPIIVGSLNVNYRYYVGLPATGVIQVGENDHLYFDTERAYKIPATRTTPDTSPVPLEDVTYYARPSASSAGTFTFVGTEQNKWRSARFAKVTFLTNGTTGAPFSAITSISGANISVANSSSFFAGATVMVLGASVNTTHLVTAVSSSTVTVNPAPSGSGSGSYLHSITGGTSVGGIKVYTANGFFNFAPPLNANGTTEYLTGADNMIFFQGRGIALGTTEAPLGGEGEYRPLRIRYSAIVNPFYNDDPGGHLTVAGNIANWHSDVPGKGGFIDLDRGGRILFGAVINARLLLCLDRGVAELRSTGTTDTPFAVRYFDSVLGSISPTGFAHLDSHIFSIGSSGIIAIKPQATLLNSLFNTSRIDRDIVDEYKRIEFDNNQARTITITRDTFDERVYTNFTSNDFRRNNRSVVYNYRYNTYALFRERFNAQGEACIMRANLNVTDANMSAAALALVSAKPLSVGGTYQGVFLARGVKQSPDPDVLISNIVGNADNVTSTITSVGHTLEVNEYVRIQDVSGDGFDDGADIMQVKTVQADSFTVDEYYGGTYTGGALCTLLDNFSIRTAEFKPFWDRKRQVRLSAIFLMEITQDVGFTVNVYSSFNRTTPVAVLDIESSYRGGNANPAPIRWYKEIRNFIGDTISLEITLSDKQMRTFAYHEACHCLHGLQLTLEPTGSIH